MPAATRHLMLVAVNEEEGLLAVGHAEKVTSDPVPIVSSGNDVQVSCVQHTSHGSLR